MTDSKSPQQQSLVQQSFSHSLYFDWVLYPYDIQVSQAYASMLNRVGFLESDETENIINALNEIKDEIDQGKYPFNVDQPDIHTSIEQGLIQKVGEIGEKIYIGRSKYDTVATDLRLWMKDEISNLQKLITNLQKSILMQASKYVSTYMPGFTDLQPTQTITLGHQMISYIEALNRDKLILADLVKRVDTLPLGTSFGAGTSLQIDRIFLADTLGFSKVSNNSIDALADRDFLLEYLFSLSMISQHMSRICEDLILWSTKEFSYVSFPKEFTAETLKTSKLRRSIVPELIRGRTGKIFGALQAALVTIKGLPYHYTRDYQEDKEGCLEASDSIKLCLETLSNLFSSLVFNEERMLKSLRSGHFETMILVEHLIKNGMGLKEANSIIMELVDFCEKNNKSFEQLKFEELLEVYKDFGNEVMILLKPKGSVQNYASLGSSNPTRVKHEIEEWNSRLNTSRII